MTSVNRERYKKAIAAFATPRRFLATAFRDNIFFLASAISFDALMAAVPLSLLYLSVVGYLFGPQAEQAGSLQVALDIILPGTTGDPTARNQMEQLIRAVIKSRAELSYYGIPLFLFFSTRLFASVRIALDEILGSTTRRRWRHDLLHDLFLVFTTAALFTAGSVLTIPLFESSLLNRIAVHLTSVGFGAVLFFIVYFFTPTERMSWRTVAVVATGVSVVFEIIKLSFGLYVASFVTIGQVISHANAIALLLFVIWVYVAALVVLFGAETAKGVSRGTGAFEAIG
ncbi:MAG: YihY/virulence factor BrkB family protein [Gemmatimonadota bacterium]|nr:YihY/virulence factor BrkB family protein [Gemmatimonadota bacterium]MDH5805284.1 YihY/virulence factor BrkB family protein [Gemmatimonadota bacterium]